MFKFKKGCIRWLSFMIKCTLWLDCVYKYFHHWMESRKKLANWVANNLAHVLQVAGVIVANSLDVSIEICNLCGLYFSGAPCMFSFLSWKSLAPLYFYFVKQVLCAFYTRSRGDNTPRLPKIESCAQWHLMFSTFTFMSFAIRVVVSWSWKYGGGILYSLSML